MTATPIPRTAAMTVYGDLDVSILDELPPGRTPINTEWAVEEKGVWEKVQNEIANGKQAYVVCPLIEESEKMQVASAEQTHAALKENELLGMKVGLLHGRLSGSENHEIMKAFRSGETDVLSSLRPLSKWE